MPRSLLDQEVLNQLAAQLTNTDRLTTKYTTCWWLPTTVSQYATTWSKKPKTVMGYYKEKFMGNIEIVSKIFVPMNDSNLHWYLLVVDMKEKELVLLDSNPCSSRTDWRKLSVKIVEIYLEEMFMDDRFYQSPITPKPQISKFKLVEPTNLCEQTSGSNDCGIYVAQWMINCIWTDDYKDIYVNDGKRMMLALNLVLKPYNKMKEEVVELAYNNLENLKKGRKSLVKIEGDGK